MEGNSVEVGPLYDSILIVGGNVANEDYLFQICLLCYNDENWCGIYCFIVLILLRSREGNVKGIRALLGNIFKFKGPSDELGK